SSDLHYGLDSAGWGSPFLLVPEATTVDEDTLAKLIASDQTDFYLSDSSPLGVPFNNFKGSTAEPKRIERVAKGVPGSPCTKKYLVSNTDFTEEPICTAYRVYQHAKIKDLHRLELPEAELHDRVDKITPKPTLCGGVGQSAYLTYDNHRPSKKPALSVCPGPSTAYVNEAYTFKQVVDYIYGRRLLALKERSHKILNELQPYAD